MRILVYGAGVLGCELAHELLKNKKNRVTLLARGEWRERIDQKGLVIRHWVQRRTTTDRIQTVDTLAPDDVYDLVFVVVQAGQVPDVLPVLKQNRSEYFVFVGNQPHARSVMQAMQRPADRVAFGFQSAAGRRERDLVISVHAAVGMTVGGATSPLSGKFRLKLITAFHGTGYRLTYYGDMDEWLKSHIAAILPMCYVCYACGGDMTKVTKAQRVAMVDAMFEACQMLKAANVPVNDADNTDYFRTGTSKRRVMDAEMLAICKTPLGKLCVSNHAMHAAGEMRYLDEAFAALRKTTSSPMPTWDALRAAMPAWDVLEGKEEK